ncbi:MAG: hypothetical protein BWY78_01511 [Alphaproteobacteria bacterium ADurb.Bin438]|nr:MAG: hypothetical protein BWY78_01511 [Alphaproteobacteria bacterium ADurb.Bin438]
MKESEIVNIQAYLRSKFGTERISIKKGDGKDAPVEVYINKEFVGPIYRNEDEGEVSYDFVMSILKEDLE